MFNMKWKHVPLVLSVILTCPSFGSLTGLCLCFESSDDFSSQSCSAWSFCEKLLQLLICVIPAREGENCAD